MRSARRDSAFELRGGVSFSGFLKDPYQKLRSSRTLQLFREVTAQSPGLSQDFLPRLFVEGQYQFLMFERA